METNRNIFSNANFISKNLILGGVILLCLAILSSLHFHNGFPLLLRDSINFLHRAFKLKESSHWSNTYTIYVAFIFRLFGTLQFVAIFQNLMVVGVLFIFCKHVLRSFTYLKFIGIIILLVFSTLPWISTMIMSDIFTPLTFIILFLFFEKRLSKSQLFILTPILFIGLSSHQSHLAIIPIFVSGLLLSKIFRRKLGNKRNLLCLLGFIVVLFVVSNLFEKNIMNWVAPPKIDSSSNNEINTNTESSTTTEIATKNADISSGYYFLAFRMYEAGQLDKLLEGFCGPDNTNYLCSDKEVAEDEIRVKMVNYHKRHEDHYLYKIYSNDNKEFVLYCFLQPRFYYGCAKLVVMRGFKLMLNPNIQNYLNPRFVKDKKDLFIRDFNKLDPRDVAYYKKSKQKHIYYPKFIKKVFPVINMVWWKIILPITLIIFIVMFLRDRKLWSLAFDELYVIFWILYAHIVNTLICGTFSNFENARYSSRTLWMINLGILILINFLFNYRKGMRSKECS